MSTGICSQFTGVVINILYNNINFYRHQCGLNCRKLSFHVILLKGLVLEKIAPILGHCFVKKTLRMFTKKKINI